jgi:hypothetical protein
MSELERATRTVPRRVLASQQRFHRVGVKVDAARQSDDNVDAARGGSFTHAAALASGWPLLVPCVVDLLLPKLAMRGGPVANSVVRAPSVVRGRQRLRLSGVST